ncbi:MAG: exonuclease domain-containing protein [Flavobacteriales bacterium]
MKIRLQKPLCFFDLETTGTQITKDRIVQLAIVKLNPDGTKEDRNFMVNPEITIPDEISAIHGITDEMVKDKPKLTEVAEDIIAFFDHSDLAGYNSNKFDIPFLVEEFLRINKPFPMEGRHFIDVQNIFHKMEQRTLAAAYTFYCGQTMENAHDALYDTQVTLDVFLAQLERYESLSNEVKELAEFSKNSAHGSVDFAGRLAKNEKQEIIYNFGKHKGKTIEKVLTLEPGYYGWMLEADFPNETKQKLRDEVQRIKALREQNKEEQLSDKLSQLASKFNKK